MVKKIKRVRYVPPSNEEAMEFGKTGISGWCLKNLKGNWCVHEVMKYFEDCHFPEYHLLVDNFDDLQKVETGLLATSPAMYMVKPFLTQKLLSGNTIGE